MRADAPAAVGRLHGDLARRGLVEARRVRPLGLDQVLDHGGAVAPVGAGGSCSNRPSAGSGRPSPPGVVAISVSRGDALRVGDRELLRDHPAEREADDVGALDPVEPVERLAHERVEVGAVEVVADDEAPGVRELRAEGVVHENCVLPAPWMSRIAGSVFAPKVSIRSFDGRARANSSLAPGS